MQVPPQNTKTNVLWIKLRNRRRMGTTRIVREKIMWRTVAPIAVMLMVSLTAATRMPRMFLIFAVFLKVQNTHVYISFTRIFLYQWTPTERPNCLRKFVKHNCGMGFDVSICLNVLFLNFCYFLNRWWNLIWICIGIGTTTIVLALLCFWIYWCDEQTFPWIGPYKRKWDERTGKCKSKVCW